MTDLSKFADIVGDFKKDADKEQKGVWMTYKRHQYLVARSHRNNAKFFKMMEERMRPYQWAIDRSNFGAIKDVAELLMQAVYSETILLGIRKTDGKEPDNADGTVLSYTPADGLALFSALPDLWDEVFKFANQEANYSPDQVKDDSKNS